MLDKTTERDPLPWSLPQRRDRLPGMLARPGRDALPPAPDPPPVACARAATAPDAPAGARGRPDRAARARAGTYAPVSLLASAGLSWPLLAPLSHLRRQGIVLDGFSMFFYGF